MNLAMKWALPFCLLAGAIHAGAQATVVGATTLEYDAQTNTMVGDCTMNPSYSTQAYYTPYTDCEVYDSTNTLIGCNTGTSSASVQFTPRAGDTYTTYGAYLLIYSNVTETYTEVYYPPYWLYEYAYEFWDPYDFSYYGEGGVVDYPPGFETWNGFWDPSLYVDAAYTYLGEVPSEPAGGPHHVKVLIDNEGFPQACPTTGIYFRQMEMQVVDPNGNPLVGTSSNPSIQEAFSNLSSNSCGNGSPIPSACAPTDPNSEFLDTMSVAKSLCGFGIVQGSGCGYTLTSTWSVCGGSGSNAIWTSPRTTQSNQIVVNGKSTQWPVGTPLFP
jgi:hypothetical protein